MPCGYKDGSCFGMDLDDVFAFEGPHIVRIRDKRLGLLHYFLMVVIFLYIVIYQVIFQNSYLLFATPVPSVRLSLQQPTIGNCSPNSQGCLDDLPNVSAQSYCNQPEGGCVFLDGVAASSVSGNQIFVSTFIKEYDQTANSSCTYERCSKIWNSKLASSSYVANIEAYTIAFDHSLAVPELSISKTTRDMDGALYIDTTTDGAKALCRDNSAAVSNLKSRAATNNAPCYIPPDGIAAGNVDFFRISTLLQAMNIDFDSTLTADSSGSLKSVRTNGFSATIEIHYFNVLPTTAGRLPIQYYYRLIPILAPYKLVGAEWVLRPTRRAKLDRRGVLFTVATSGQLGAFDFLTLLLTLTSSMALLAVSATLVKFLALYVLKQKSYFEALIYQKSPQLNGVSSLENRSDGELHQLLESSGLPTFGTRQQQILRYLEHKTETDRRLELERSKTNLKGYSCKVAPADSTTESPDACSRSP